MIYIHTIGHLDLRWFSSLSLIALVFKGPSYLSSNLLRVTICAFASSDDVGSSKYGCSSLSKDFHHI